MGSKSIYSQKSLSFYDGKSPNKIKFSLLLNVTETQTPLEDYNMKCCPKEKEVDWLNYTSFLLLCLPNPHQLRSLIQ